MFRFLLKTKSNNLECVKEDIDEKEIEKKYISHHLKHNNAHYLMILSMHERQNL